MIGLTETSQGSFEDSFLTTNNDHTICQVPKEGTGIKESIIDILNSIKKLNESHDKSNPVESKSCHLPHEEHLNDIVKNTACPQNDHEKQRSSNISLPSLSDIQLNENVSNSSFGKKRLSSSIDRSHLLLYSPYPSPNISDSNLEDSFNTKNDNMNKCISHKEDLSKYSRLKRNSSHSTCTCSDVMFNIEENRTSNSIEKNISNKRTQSLISSKEDLSKNKLYLFNSSPIVKLNKDDPIISNSKDRKHTIYSNAINYQSMRKRSLPSSFQYHHHRHPYGSNASQLMVPFKSPNSIDAIKGLLSLSGSEVTNDDYELKENSLNSNEENNYFNLYSKYKLSSSKNSKLSIKSGRNENTFDISVSELIKQTCSNLSVANENECNTFSETDLPRKTTSSLNSSDSTQFSSTDEDLPSDSPDSDSGKIIKKTAPLETNGLNLCSQLINSYAKEKKKKKRVHMCPNPNCWKIFPSLSRLNRHSKVHQSSGL